MWSKLWCLAWFLRATWRHRPSTIQAQTVLVTLRHKFSTERDTYFGSLHQWLEQSGYHPLTVAIYEQGAEHQPAMPPVESWLSWTDRVACVRAVWSRALPTRAAVGQALLEAMMQCVGRVMQQQMKLRRVVIPYEGRAWERRFLVGVRSASPTVRCIGYSHAIITTAHHVQWHSDGPDVVVTLGELNRHHLIEVFGHPAELVKTAGSLRTQKTLSFSPRRRGAAHLLVALATDIDEAHLALQVIEQARLWMLPVTIRIRPHPTVPLPSRPAWPHEYSTGDLSADIRWADVVCYVRSTVAVESLAHGVPILALSVTHDPFRDFAEHYVINPPVMTFPFVLASLETMSDEVYAKRQRAGVAYAMMACAPMTDEAFTVLAEA